MPYFLPLNRLCLFVCQSEASKSEMWRHLCIPNNFKGAKKRRLAFSIWLPRESGYPVCEAQCASLPLNTFSVRLWTQICNNYLAHICLLISNRHFMIKQCNILRLPHQLFAATSIICNFFADPDKARGCSTSTVMVNLSFHWVTTFFRCVYGAAKPKPQTVIYNTKSHTINNITQA